MESPLSVRLSVEVKSYKLSSSRFSFLSTGLKAE